VAVKTMKLLTLFKALHFIGLAMFFLGLWGYFFTQMSLELSGMLVLSSLIGVGLMLMSPYPIVLFLQWAQQQTANQAANQSANSSANQPPDSKKQNEKD
jgi:uncharacterized membrane protein